MTLARRERGRGAVSGGVLVAIGAAAWVVAWFVPAASLAGSASGDTMIKSSPDAGPFYGFHAFWWAAQLVPDALGSGELHMLVLGATCATNFVMLAALMLHRFVPWGRALAFAALACAPLNTTWLWLCEADMVAGYRAGYYLWLASFVLVGIGIACKRERT